MGEAKRIKDPALRAAQRGAYEKRKLINTDPATRLAPKPAKARRKVAISQGRPVVMKVQ